MVASGHKADVRDFLADHLHCKAPQKKIYARPQNLPYTVLAPSISEVSRGVGDMDWVGARRWWRGGGGEFFVS